MARPDYIARLHAAKYDFRFCASGEEAGMLRRYREALAQASREAALPEDLLEAAVARDFGVWVRQEGLPKLPRQP